MTAALTTMLTTAGVVVLSALHPIAPAVAAAWRRPRPSPLRRGPGGRSPAGPAAPARMGSGPPAWVRSLPTVLAARRSATRRDAQLPDALEQLASALRAGAALGPAVVEVAASFPEPLGADLRAIAESVQHGEPVARALQRWAERRPSSTAVRLSASALGLGVEVGGQLARSVDQVAATLRERQELQGEVGALATQARASAVVLGAAPVAFTALVSTVEPGVLGFLLGSPLGWACLVAGVALEGAGAWWMARIVAAAR